MVNESQYTVSELTSQIRSLLEGTFADIWVTGEISNFHHHSSGHMYFTLKDSCAELRCAMFRQTNRLLRFHPEDGMRIRVFGSVSVYEQRGQVQFIVRKLKPAGVGDLFQAYEALKKRLAEEGLFADDHKQALPIYPKTVGVVTSGTGAALRDILHVLARRAPHVRVILRSSQVQGEGAAEDIAAGIADLEQYAACDVIIIGRGGGSLEDLWAFNEEITARAVFSCTLPIISAVGHETDISITDLIADLRAPTPSAAAEIVSPSRSEILKRAKEVMGNLQFILQKKLETYWLNVDGLDSRLILLQPMRKIERKLEQLSQLSHRLEQSIIVLLKRGKDRVLWFNKQLISLSPRQVLERGYAIAFKKETGDIIRSAVDIDVGDFFHLRTGQGSMEAEKKADLKN